jgi:type IV secretion system protein VirB10
LLSGLNSKTAKVGNPVRLKTAFPVSVAERVVIPPGSYVTGTVARVERPGRIRGRAEIQIRFETLLLPNGAQRDFSAMISAVQGVRQGVKSSQGTLEAPKGDDTATVGRSAAEGAAETAIETTNDFPGPGAGAIIGGTLGALGGIGSVLITRGPEVQLPAGTSIEVRLLRNISFDASELEVE